MKRARRRQGGGTATPRVPGPPGPPAHSLPLHSSKASDSKLSGAAATLSDKAQLSFSDNGQALLAPNLSAEPPTSKDLNSRVLNL